MKILQNQMEGAILVFIYFDYSAYTHMRIHPLAQRFSINVVEQFLLHICCCVCLCVFACMKIRDRSQFALRIQVDDHTQYKSVLMVISKPSICFVHLPCSLVTIRVMRALGVWHKFPPLRNFSSYKEGCLGLKNPNISGNHVKLTWLRRSKAYTSFRRQLTLL